MTSDPASLERRHLADLMTLINTLHEQAPALLGCAARLLGYCSQQLNVQPIDSAFNADWPRIATAYQ